MNSVFITVKNFKEVNMRITATLCFAVLLFAVAAYAAGEHPAEMGKKECITCHSDSATVSKPNVVAEWNQSLHSYSGVSCGNCHGDESNFQLKPLKATCESCHSEKVAVTKSALPCESCHIAHTFNVHRKTR